MLARKKPNTLKIFNYLQNDGASNYNYSLKNEIAELRIMKLLTKHLK